MSLECARNFTLGSISGLKKCSGEKQELPNLTKKSASPTLVQDKNISIFLLMKASLIIENQNERSRH